MPNIVVTHLGGDRFDLAVRGHRLSVDQPMADGGEDTAPTPTELFVSSLAACVAFYARRYLSRHGLPTEGLGAEADFEFASRPARVGAIRVRLLIPDGVPAENLAPLLAVASHCTVHNSLGTPPSVEIELGGRREAAA
jgi:putative redox protein